MERRAGVFVEAVANTSTQKAATDAFNTEMEDIGEAESAEALKSMGQMIDDLGVCPLPDSLIASGSLDLDISFESDDTMDDQQQNNASTPRQTLSLQFLMIVPKLLVILHT